MARFSEQFINQVAQATDIVDLIGGYLALTKKGKEFVGLCPFHDDHKPSMYVNPVKQIFKCFSCGAGGGVFQFVMMYEKLEFPEAVKMLAERANIPLPRDNAVPEPTGGFSKSNLAGVMNFAQDFFHENLKSPSGAAALEYARNRGFTDESLSRFGIGYAPDFWDSLLRAAAREGISENALIAAGLVIKREGREGCYDRFRNRLMFPIYDATGKLIAFGGRALSSDDQAKYLNSPETVLFDKSNNFYALNWSREGISKSGVAVVVEGYLDALMPLQAGLDNVVATLGTALTDRHVKLLSRYAKTAVLIFDADVAGQKAAERGLEIFLSQQLNVRVATIPAGKDPCDYVLAEGQGALRRLIDESPDALQYIWDRRQRQLQESGANLAQRREHIEDFLRLVVTSSSYGAIDPLRRGQLVQHIGHMLNISPTELEGQMRRMGREIPRATLAARQDNSSAVPSGSEPHKLAERQILEVLLNESDLFDIAAERIGPSDFMDASYRRIAGRLWTLCEEGKGRLEDMLHCQELTDLSPLLTELATAGEQRGNFEKTLSDAVGLILYHRDRKDAAPGELSDDDALRQLVNRAKQPDPRRHSKIK